MLTCTYPLKIQSLRWEPFAKELDNFVEKKWNMIQEEAIERKQLRTLINASNATIDAMKGLRKKWKY